MLSNRFSWFVMLFNFGGLNTPPVADFELPTWCGWSHRWKAIPLILGFDFCSFCYPWPTLAWNRMLLLLTRCQEANSSLTSHQMPLSFTSLQPIKWAFLSSQVTTRRAVVTIRYFGVEGAHSHDFQCIYCFNGSVLLLLLISSCA